jgi:predicted NAD-dependent protein-ADP-ribosyltransferase YbiA (DUF1768 family)
MSLELRNELAILSPDLHPDLKAWLDLHDGQVFRLRAIRGEAFFQALGPEAEVRRIPINITSRSPGSLKLISNFAQTPFFLDGLNYASVEGFWQSLKFSDDVKRREVAALHGPKARDIGFRAPEADVISYQGKTIRIGTWAHWQLMEHACAAKFDQHDGASEALLSTGNRPLTHQMKQDSHTIPGVIMAEIWMRCRSRILKAQTKVQSPYAPQIEEPD